MPARRSPWPHRLPLYAGLWLSAWLLATGAQAQVQRCEDAHTGRVTYTDGDCRSGESALLIEAAPTPQEQAAQAARDRQALERREAELRLQAQRRAEQAASAPVIPPPAPQLSPTPQNSPACRQAQAAWEQLNQAGRSDRQTLDSARQQAELQCLTAEAYADLQKSRQPPALVNQPWGYRPPQSRPQLHPPQPPPPRPPSGPVQCNVFRCYDGKGNQYPRP